MADEPKPPSDTGKMEDETKPTSTQPPNSDWQPISNQHSLPTGANTAQPVTNQPSMEDQYGIPAGAHTVQPQPYTATQHVPAMPHPNPRVNLWSHGLCGCLNDLEACCMACWIPCVVFGRNAEAVGKDCFLWGTFCGVGTLLGMPCVPGSLLRDEIRRERGIDGDSCNDCLVWTCCGVCALTQEAQEIRQARYEQSMQGFTRT